MQIRTIVVVALSSALTGIALGADKSGGGISDVIRLERSVPRKSKISTSERSGAVAQTDGSTQAPTEPEALPASVTCNFSGFPSKDAVIGAYGGGASSSGVHQTNLGVTFAGATVLNAWNGSGSPDPAVAYAPSGQMVIGSNASSQHWDAIEFFYCSRTKLRIDGYLTMDGSGVPVQSVEIPANIAAAPFSTWTPKRVDFALDVKSIRISGEADMWGIDALTALQGSPECSYGDYVALSFNQPVEANNTTISFSNPSSNEPAFSGTSIRYRNVATLDGRSVDARVSVSNFVGGPTWDGHIPNFRQSNGSSLPNSDHGLVYSTNGIGQDSIDLKFEFFEGGGSFAVPVYLPKFRLVVYDVDGQSGLQEERVSIAVPTGQAGFFGYQHDAFVVPSSQPGLLTFTGTGQDQPHTSTAAVILHFAGAREVQMKMIGNQTSGSGRDPIFHGFDGDMDSVGDIGRFTALAPVRTPPTDCNGNGIVDSCEIASGTAADCDADNVLDTCELASGAEVDQNGNGVPDSCDPFPTLVLTANAAACNAVGSTVDVEARLSGVLNLVVAGQLVLDWDPTKLELVASNPGDAPYASSFLVNNAAGLAVILVSANPGGSGTAAPSAIVSRLRFQILGGSCDGSGTSIGFGTYMGMLETAFTDGVGTSIEPTLVASTGFVVDDGAPVLSNVPADVSVQAYAGENGFALVSLGTPTATDACAPGLTATGVRSDGQALGAAWPSGTTTVTWRAVDPCGNEAVDFTSVTVEPFNTLDLSVSLAGGGFAPSLNRDLQLSVQGAGGTQARSVSALFSTGTASVSLTDLPIDAYGCITVEDTARSLRRRVNVTDGGATWTATASLVLGDIIDDEVIDVLDWGAYVVSNPNADLDGDGVITAADGQFILDNFGVQGDGVCGSPLDGPPTARESVSVAELVQMGLPELAGADLNGDGWLDLRDMAMAD